MSILDDAIDLIDRANGLLARNGPGSVPCDDKRGGGCLRRQGNARDGLGSPRPHIRYKVDEMCSSCEAFWHTERALIVLRDLRRRSA